MVNASTNKIKNALPCETEVGLTSLPAEHLTVARYLAARASIATLRLATSAVAKAHEWAGRESPCRDPGVPL